MFVVFNCNQQTSFISQQRPVKRKKIYRKNTKNYTQLNIHKNRYDWKCGSGKRRTIENAGWKTVDWKTRHYGRRARRNANAGLENAASVGALGLKISSLNTVTNLLTLTLPSVFFSATTVVTYVSHVAQWADTVLAALPAWKMCCKQTYLHEVIDLI